jgi:hypothetical protein
MRAQGVIAAQWSADGALVTVTLGPKPTEPSTKRPHHPSVAESREEHRRIALGAGSSLVKRVGEEG